MSELREAAPEPTVGPGQIWLVEQAPGAELSPLDYRALTTANVVIYDRALASLVARELPVGSYAEPLPRGTGPEGGSAISRRGLDFAAAGWSVVQLVEARSGVHAGLRDAAETLAGAGVSVRVIDRSHSDAARNTARNTCLPELPQLIDGFDDDDLLTLVFGPLAVRHPAPTLAFTANGLAG